MNGLLGFGDKLYQAFLVEDRWRLYLDGLGVTLGITLGAICISTVLGMVLCLMKMSRHRILRWPAQAYIDIIRGIPVVVQLLIMYNVVLLNVTDNKMVVAVIAFGLNSSAYMAEIYRSGINAVDPGQMEAGRSLGLSKVQTMWSVIFPQALKNCLPTYTSEFIVLVKETAVVGYIALTDLTKVYSAIQSKTYDAFGPLFITVSIFLFAFSSLVGNYYYTESNFRFIRDSKTGLLVFRLTCVAAIFIGAQMSFSMVWDLADVLMGLMALVNLVAILLLGGKAIRVLRDYQKQRRAGKNPVYRYDEVGVGSPEIWNEAHAKKWED